MFFQSWRKAYSMSRVSVFFVTILISLLCKKLSLFSRVCFFLSCFLEAVSLKLSYGRSRRTSERFTKRRKSLYHGTKRHHISKTLLHPIYTFSLVRSFGSDYAKVGWGKSCRTERIGWNVKRALRLNEKFSGRLHENWPLGVLKDEWGYTKNSFNVN